MKKLGDFFVKLWSKFGLFRFKYTLPAHLKLTKFKPYKKWSDFKFSNHLNFAFLFFFLMGLGFGFYGALPKNTQAYLSGNPILHEIPSNLSGPSMIRMAGNKVYYFQNNQVVEYDISNGATNSFDTGWTTFFDADGTNLVYSQGPQLIIQNLSDKASYGLRMAPGYGGYIDNISIKNNIVAWTEYQGYPSGWHEYYYNLSVDTDGNGIPNYKEAIRPDPDPALFELPAGYRGTITTDGHYITRGSSVYDIQSATDYVLDASGGDSASVNNGQVVYRLFNGSNYDVIYYDLIVDSNNDGIPNFKDPVRPNPDPARKVISTTGMVPEAMDTLGIGPNLDGNLIVWEARDANNVKHVESYDLATGVQKSFSDFDTSSVVTNGIYAAFNGLVDGYNKIYYSQFVADNSEPAFANLPGTTEKINYADGQIVKTSGITVKVKPTDADSQISKVNFYFDDVKITSLTQPQADGTYQATLDIPYNKVGGLKLMARAYDQAFNYSDLVITIVPDPMVTPYTITKQLTDSNEATNKYLYAANKKYYTYDDNNGNSFLVNVATGEKTLLDKNLYFVGTGSSISDNYVGGYSLNPYEYYKIADGTYGSIPKSGSAGWSQLVGNDLYYLDDKNGIGISGVYKRNLDTGEDSLVYSQEGSEWSSWAPYTFATDGKTLLIDFQTWSYGSNTNKLVSVDTETGNATSIYDNNDYVDYLSAYGGKVAFGCQDGGTWKLIYANANGTDLRTLDQTINDGYIGIRGTALSSKYLAYGFHVKAGTDEIRVYDIQKDKTIIIASGDGVSARYPYMEDDTIFYRSRVGSGQTEIYMTTISYDDIIKPEIISVTGLSGVAGSTVQVKVEATDNVAVTRGQISIGGGAWQEMTGNGSPFTYNLAIPASQVNPISYKVRVSDPSGNYAEASETLIVTNNTIQFVQSVDGLKATTGDPDTIKIKLLEGVNVSNVRVVFGEADAKPANLSNGYYQYTFNAPLNSTASIPFKVWATDSSGRTLEKSGYVVTVNDNKPPVIKSITAPKDPKTGGTVTVVAEDNIKAIKGEVTLDEGKSWNLMSGNDSIFTYQLAASSKTVKYSVRISDEAGNVTLANPDEIKAIIAAQNVEPTIATIVRAAMARLVQSTPAPVAKAFPYILFLLLGLSALVFMRQVEVESEQLGTKMELVKFRRLIVEQKDNFVILASHYLRTPVTLISNGAEMLMESLKGEGKSKLKAAVTALVAATQEVVAKIENSEQLKEIKLPDPKKETLKIIFSPFVVVPVVAVGGLAFTANYVFQNAGKINLTWTNLLIEIAAFVIAVQVFVYFYRKRRIQKANLKYFDETMKYEVAIDESKSVLMVNSKKTLEDQLALVKSALPKKANDFVDEGTKRLEQILSKIGYLSGLKFSDIQTSPKGFEVSGLIKEIVKSKGAVAAENRVKIETQFSDGEITKNREIVKEILSELVDNAIKFSPKGGTVKITCAKDADGLSNISITDEGKGITKDEQMALFKPFSRTSSALHFNHEGLGLGLYYSRSLTNMLGGDIFINSAKDKGTTVTVNI